VALAGQARGKVGVAQQAKQYPRRDHGVGEVREHPVDAELIELQVFVHGVARVVGLDQS